MKGQQTKHTPGPYRVSREYHTQIVTVDESIKKGGLVICEVFGATADQTQANAHLIAAAPQMYESLTALESRLTACARAFYVEGNAKALKAAFEGWKSDIEPARAVLGNVAQE